MAFQAHGLWLRCVCIVVRIVLIRVRRVTTCSCLMLYNDTISQGVIGAETPIRALKQWWQQKSELSFKRIYAQAGRESCTHMLEPAQRMAGARTLFIYELV